MSRRAENRRRQRELHKGRPHRRSTKFELPDGDFAVQMAWAPDADAIEEAKQLTHDTLIDLMGDTRTGGVRWSWAEGDEALAMVDVLEANGTSVLWREYAGQIRGRLEASGGWIVVAIAPGQAPEGTYG